MDRVVVGSSPTLPTPGGSSEVEHVDTPAGRSLNHPILRKRGTRLLRSKMVKHLIVIQETAGSIPAEIKNA